ncbi:MAG: ferredoxin [Desulfobacteraceae bacterium]|jgi:ferredoxin
MKKPVVDIGLCSLCMGCVEVCPDIFSLNDQTGYIEVADVPSYPEEKVNEAIKYCPEDCISWEEE